MSREFSEELGGRLIIEASQAGAIVVGDESVEIGVAFGVVEKAAVMSGAVLRHAAEVVTEAAIEALDHAVGLRPEGPGEAMIDAMARRSGDRRLVAERFVERLCAFCRRRSGR